MTRPRRLRERLPFGLGVADKPRHYREMVAAAWENRGSLRHAWRILHRGVCDGCSLGPRGLRDDVLRGTHLCLTRLRLLRLNTSAPMSEAAAREWLGDLERLRRLDEAALRALGRLPWPLLWQRGERGFRRIPWSEALAICGRFGRGEDGRRLPPARWAFFSTSRGVCNEAYYVFQKAARLLGTNNVDLAARLCHAASVDGLAQTLGIGAPTCSLRDFIGTDLLLVWGSDLVNNQPVAAKYLVHAKRRGTRIAVVNPALEKGLRTYWVPSDWRSAIFGTDLCDDWYQVRVGGDIALIHGVLKALLRDGREDREFIAAHTTGFEDLRAFLESLAWERLERDCGLARADMERFAQRFAAARAAVAVYSMGLTQHAFGVDNVRAIVNLMLARGMIGRERCGIMPIRGHSGVQGGGECGVDPARYPGGFKVGLDTPRFEDLWGHALNPEPGLRIGAMLEAAHGGGVDFLYSLGGNLVDNMPDPEFMREALRRVRFRVHQDIVLNPSALVEAGEAVLVLPAQTRYEHAGGVTSTSTERRVRFSPEIPGPRVPEARPEWWIPAQVAMAVDPALRDSLEYPGGTPQIRSEMERAIPCYRGVAALRRAGDSIQWGGPQLFAGGDFDRMPGGRARFSCVPLPNQELPPGRFVLTTRRGKQFNSIVFGGRDAVQGGRSRNDVFIARPDAELLGLREGDRVLLRSETGRLEGIVRFGELPPRTLQAYWPEANVLIPRRYDPVSGEPDYNACVEVVTE